MSVWCGADVPDGDPTPQIKRLVGEHGVRPQALRGGIRRAGRSHGCGGHAGVRALSPRSREPGRGRARAGAG
ncbi:hypothetical protein, partial [Streptomyces sp. NRRL F-4707]|uniref:hypothetical protein n=1 Tax=Streptomyces sp. NRRL F-4707 TaxID=1519496 RepID=UPI001F186151